MENVSAEIETHISELPTSSTQIVVDEMLEMIMADLFLQQDELETIPIYGSDNAVHPVFINKNLLIKHLTFFQIAFSNDKLMTVTFKSDSFRGLPFFLRSELVSLRQALEVAEFGGPDKVAQFKLPCWSVGEQRRQAIASEHTIPMLNYLGSRSNFGLWAYRATSMDFEMVDLIVHSAYEAVPGARQHELGQDLLNNYLFFNSFPNDYIVSNNRFCDYVMFIGEENLSWVPATCDIQIDYWNEAVLKYYKKGVEALYLYLDSIPLIGEYSQKAPYPFGENRGRGLPLLREVVSPYIYKKLLKMEFDAPWRDRKEWSDLIRLGHFSDGRRTLWCIFDSEGSDQVWSSCSLKADQHRFEYNMAARGMKLESKVHGLKADVKKLKRKVIKYKLRRSSSSDEDEVRLSEECVAYDERNSRSTSNKSKHKVSPCRW